MSPESKTAGLPPEPNPILASPRAAFASFHNRTYVALKARLCFSKYLSLFVRKYRQKYP